MEKGQKLTAAVSAGALVLAGLVGVGIFTSISNATPEPTSVVSVYEVNGFAEAPAKQVAPVVEVVPVAPVAEEPAPAEPAPQEPAPDYGTPVPWIADSNPNNAEGGYWDTTQCPSGAAYQAPDGNQYCS